MDHRAIAELLEAKEELDLSMPLHVGATVTFDAYPTLDDGNLVLDTGSVPLDSLARYFTGQLKQPVTLRQLKGAGYPYVLVATYGDKTFRVKVGVQFKKSRKSKA